MLVVPQQVEQAIVGQELEKHGAGVALNSQPPYKNISADELKSALKKLLANKEYAANSKKLGESLRTAGGPERAADEIMGFIKQKLNN